MYGIDESAYKDTVVISMHVSAGSTSEAREKAKQRARPGAIVGLAKEMAPGKYKVYVTVPR
jgi:hypothetical protein